MEGGCASVYKGIGLRTVLVSHDEWCAEACVGGGGVWCDFCAERPQRKLRQFEVLECKGNAYDGDEAGNCPQYVEQLGGDTTKIDRRTGKETHIGSQMEGRTEERAQLLVLVVVVVVVVVVLVAVVV